MFTRAMTKSMAVALVVATVLLMPQSLVLAKSLAQSHVTPSVTCIDHMLAEVKAPTSQIDFRSQIWEQFMARNGRCVFLGSIYGRSVFYHTSGAIQETLWDDLFVNNVYPPASTPTPYPTYNSTAGQALAYSNCYTGQHLESDAYGSGYYSAVIPLIASATCPNVSG